MATRAHVLASGPGWQVSDVICDAGPHDRPFEERHAAVSIAAVTAGTFQYRAEHGRALLVPGAILLGNVGACYECGHDHGVGDRCIAFHLAPDCFESVLEDVPGARHMRFSVPRLAPLPSLLPLLAEAEAARTGAETQQWEELALRLAGAVATELADDRGAAARPATWRDEARITRAVRRIEQSAEEPLSLADLAAQSAMSAYHFLRTFAEVVGQTPYQFLLRLRLQRAAVRLRRTAEPVSAIAYDAGFNDLATFNRRFRAVIGATPTAWRANPALRSRAS